MFSGTIVGKANMKTPKCVVLTVAILVVTFEISLSALGNDGKQTSPQQSAAPRIRTCYITAKNTTWNYASTGKTK